MSLTRSISSARGNGQGLEREAPGRWYFVRSREAQRVNSFSTSSWVFPSNSPICEASIAIPSAVRFVLSAMALPRQERRELKGDEARVDVRDGVPHARMGR